MTKIMALGVLTFSFLLNVIFARSYSKRIVTDDKRDSPLFLNRSNYRARRSSSSIIVGNYLYIDGGEILYDDGNQTTWIIAKSTYSVDLFPSWTNATVVIKQIDKIIDNGVFNYPALWPALDNSSFYSYNGGKSKINNPIISQFNKLYKFTPDSSGGGQWTEDDQSYTANSNFTNLVRVSGFASACGSDTCYAIGGRRNAYTDDALENEIPAAGIVSFNLTSRHWCNDSLVGSMFTGPWRDGQLFFTNVVGSEGILIATGGSVTNLAGENSISLSFSYAYIYDIATKSWYQQETEGDVPSIYGSPYCTVGLKGGNSVNKTYEIFMFVSYGESGENNDVWVLSLPSFQWYRAGQPSRGRCGHSCSVAGHRQMIIVGGYRSDIGSEGDDWPLGLGVFDLSEMKFKDRYDAGASVYTSPEVVERWYAENGSMAKNINADVKALFDRSSAADRSVSSVLIPTEARSSSSSSSSSDSVSTGAIAGGVVGGVIFLAAVIAVIWTFIWRRHHRPNTVRNISQPFNIQPFVPEPFNIQPFVSQPFNIEPFVPRPVESDGRTAIQESDTRARFEVDGQQVHETEAQQRYELS